jgi:beta-galactosidase
VTVPSDAHFCWPLRLDVAGLRLEWATAQPVCTVQADGRTVLVLAATEGIAAELALDAGTVASVSVPGGDIADVEGRVLLVTGLRPGTDALVEVETVDGRRIGLLVLDAATARTVYRGEAWGAERLVLCAGGVVFDQDEVRVHSTAGEPSFAVLPAPERAPVVGRASASETGWETGLETVSEAVRETVPYAVSEAPDGVFTRYTVRGGDAERETSASVALVRPAGPAPEPATGVLGRASTPADKYFDTVAAEYRVDVPDDLPSGVGAASALDG